MSSERWIRASVFISVYVSPLATLGLPSSSGHGTGNLDGGRTCLPFIAYNVTLSTTDLRFLTRLLIKCLSIILIVLSFRAHVNMFKIDLFSK